LVSGDIILPLATSAPGGWASLVLCPAALWRQPCADQCGDLEWR